MDRFFLICIGLFLLPHFCFAEGQAGLELIFQIAFVVILVIIAFISFFVLKIFAITLKKSWSNRKIMISSLLIGFLFLLILYSISYPSVNWLGF